MGGWMVGHKSRFKDCLHQSKMEECVSQWQVSSMVERLNSNPIQRSWVQILVLRNENLKYIQAVIV